jgi:hypothetical protein
MEERDRERVERNVHDADTEDLLDRVTAYRRGMEPEAVMIIEDELSRRGYGRADIEDYEARACADVVRRPEGFAYRCSFCDRPAVLRRWGLHKLWGLLTVPFPRPYSYCRDHLPEPVEVPETDDADGP